MILAYQRKVFKDTILFKTSVLLLRHLNIERGLTHNFKQFVKNSGIFVTESFYEGDRLSSIESYYHINVHTTAKHCSVFELHQIRKDMYEYIKTFKPSHKEWTI